MQTLLLLGDSLIEYGDWNTLLSEYATVNRGMAGETTGELSARLGWEVERIDDPDHILIFSGTNDLLMGDRSFPAVFATMLPRLRQLEPEAKVTVISLAPMHIPWQPIHEIESANADLGETAHRAGCLFLDLFPAFQMFCRPVGNPCFLADGVHFSPHGYEVLAGAIRSHLESIM